MVSFLQWTKNGLRLTSDQDRRLLCLQEQMCVCVFCGLSSTGFSPRFDIFHMSELKGTFVRHGSSRNKLEKQSTLQPPNVENNISWMRRRCNDHGTTKRRHQVRFEFSGGQYSHHNSWAQSLGNIVGGDSLGQKQNLAALWL